MKEKSSYRRQPEEKAGRLKNCGKHSSTCVPECEIFHNEKSFRWKCVEGNKRRLEIGSKFMVRRVIGFSVGHYPKKFTSGICFPVNDAEKGLVISVDIGICQTHGFAYFAK